MLSSHAIIAIIAFFLAYIFIVSEKINKTIVVSLGSSILFLFGIYFAEGYDNQLLHALEFIDFNVLSLIIGMMIIVQITSKSGVFTAVAMRLIIWSGGRMKRVFLSLMLMAAFLTAFLSNVTTVMIMTPIFLAICLRFNLNPLPFLMTEILMSNIGGASTPLGDMTNIIIASKAGFSFSKVVTNLAPIIIVITLIIGLITTFYYRNELRPREKKQVDDLKKENFIKDPKLMVQGLTIIVLVVLALIFKDSLGLENGIIAMTGAMVLLLMTKIQPEKAFKEYVNWSIIFFFAGLFVMIGALEITGVVGILAEKIVGITDGNMDTLAMVLIFASSIFSAFIDNIPFATTMIPIIKDIGIMTQAPTDPLFWSLSLGACIGGSGTIVGASCNLVVVGLAEQNGLKITFMQYFKFAFGLTMLATSIAAVYLYFFLL